MRTVPIELPETVFSALRKILKNLSKKCELLPQLNGMN
jgi:hypothetical protein